MTQPELANKVGVTTVSICNWENKKSVPSATSIEKLKKIFGNKLNRSDFF